MFAKALEANGASKVYIIGRSWRKLDEAAKQSVSLRLCANPLLVPGVHEATVLHY